MSELFGNPEQLPAPAYPAVRLGLAPGELAYTADQMRAYAATARRAALEEAAQALDAWHEARKRHDNHAAVYARMLRELALSDPG